MTRLLPIPLLLAGCLYQPPDLPIETDLQIIPNNACDIQQEAFVACVHDGDTFDVGACGEDQGERIRLLGVDAPEIEHLPDPADCYGDEAYALLEGLVLSERVVLSFDEECTGVFGRTLAYAWLVGAPLEQIRDDPDVEPYLRTLPGEFEVALLLNEWLIAMGAAELFPEEQFGTLIYQDALEQAEADAQLFGRGLWGTCEAGGSTTAL